MSAIGVPKDSQIRWIRESHLLSDNKWLLTASITNPKTKSQREYPMDVAATLSALALKPSHSILSKANCMLL